MTENNFPKYVIRPDDHTIFSLNEDNETYSTHSSKIKWPDNLHHKYTYDRLIRVGFYSAPEEELSYHKSKQNQYHENLKKLFDKEKGCGD